MKFVINKPKRNQGIYIEQVDHGKFAKISSTSLLLKVGAFGPALRAGSPVTGSVTSLTRRGRFLCGVKQFFHPLYWRPVDRLPEYRVGAEAAPEERPVPS